MQFASHDFMMKRLARTRPDCKKGVEGDPVGLCEPFATTCRA